MAIRNLADLRQQAQKYPELSGLNDKELIAEYANRKGQDYGYLLNYFGIPQEGGIKSFGRQFAAGLADDLPAMAAGAVQYFAEPESELYRKAGLYKQEQQAEGARVQVDPRNLGFVRDITSTGARGLAPLIPAAAVGITAATIGAPALVVGGVGALTSGVLFGASSAQETKEKVLAAGGTEEDAAKAGAYSFIIQGAGETAATFFGAKFLGLLKGPASKTMSSVVADMTTKETAKQMAANYAKVIAAEGVTEAAQDTITAYNEAAFGAYGDQPPDYWNIAADSFKGGASLAAILGPFGTATSINRNNRVNELNRTLYSETATSAEREQARQAVRKVALDQGIAEEDVNSWVKEQIASETQLVVAQRELEEATAALQEDPTNPELKERAKAAFSIPTGIQIVDPVTGDERDASVGEILTYSKPTGQGERDLMAPAIMDADMFVNTVQSLSIGQAPKNGETEVPAAGPASAIPQGLSINRLEAVRTADYSEEDRAQVEEDLARVRNTGLSREERKAALESAAATIGQYEAARTESIMQEEAQAAPVAEQAAPTVATAAPVAEQAAPTVAPAAPAAEQAAEQAAVGQELPEYKKNEVLDEQANEVVVAQTQEQEDVDLADIQQEIDKALEAEAKELEAKVQTGEKGKVAGKKSLPPRVFAAIRNAILSPTSGYSVRAEGSIKTDPEATKQYGEKVRAAAIAGRQFIWAYKTFLDTQVLNKDKKLSRVKEKAEAAATTYADEKVGRVEQYAQKVQTAYDNLLEALDGNKKDLDVLVRILKDRVQAAKLNPKANPEHVAKWEKLDINLSRAVDEIAQTGETQPSLTFVRGQETRRSREVGAEVKSIEKEQAAIDKEAAAIAEEKQNLPAKPTKRATDKIAKREKTLADRRAALEERNAMVNKTSQLVDASEEGYAVFTSKKKETGIRGIMNYFRTNGTPYERQLATALKYAFGNMGDENAPSVKFKKTGVGKYSPKNNTITIKENVSPEVVLHESLHGALQWFVYNNPNHPAVKALVDSVDQVIEYDMEGLGKKAKDVQSLLKELKGEGRTLDAVLELISYGNTLQEFKKALDAIPSKTTPKSFVKAAQAIWTNILAVARRMIGSRGTVAEDVMNRTFELLSEAAQTEVVLAPEGKELKVDAEVEPAYSVQGRELKAEITSDSTSIETATQAELESDQKAAAAAQTSASIFKYGKQKLLIDFLPTKLLTDMIGFRVNPETGTNAVKDAISKQATEIADGIRNNFPRIERNIQLFYSHFSVSEGTSAMLNEAKTDRHVGINIGDNLSDLMRRMRGVKGRETFTQDFMNYMDGNKKAFSKYEEAELLKQIADNALTQYKKYVSALPYRQRAYIESGKFSERLFMPKFGAAVGRTLRAVGVQDYLQSQPPVVEVSLDGFKQFLYKDRNGDILLDGRKFYQKLKVQADGKVRGDGFIDADLYTPNMNIPGEIVDVSNVWTFDKLGKGGYKFVTTKSAKQALADKRSDDVHLAVQNTFAVLSQNYANQNLHKALAADDSITFSSLQAAQEASGGRRIKTITAFTTAAKNKKIMGEFRSSNAFVKIPNTPASKAAYGDLAGKYVHGPVFAALMDSVDRNPIANSRKFYKIMSAFKWTKTAGSPSTHVTNALTNLSLMYMHDIPFSAVKDAAKIYLTYKMGSASQQAKLTKEQIALMVSFENSGAMIGDYSTTELKESLYRSFIETNADEMSMPGWVSSFMEYELKKGTTVAKAAGGVKEVAAMTKSKMDMAYAAEDNVFRLALFMKQMSEIKASSNNPASYKYTAEDVRVSGRVAREGFLDYDIDSKAVRVARQTVLPFISWTYAIMPVIGKIAVTKPYKIANLFAAYGLTSMALSALAGDDDDEIRENGPKYLRERLFGFGPQAYVRIPFMGDEENPVYYNLGHYIPLASTFRGDVPAPFMGIDNWPSGLALSNPLFSLFVIAAFGVDPFTGEKLGDDTNTNLEEFGTRFVKMTDTFLPTFIDSSARNSYKDVLEDKSQKYTGVSMNSINLARKLGLRLYQHNKYEWEATEEAIIRGIESDFRQAISTLKKEEMRKGAPDYEKMDREIEKLYERMRERIKEETNEDM